MKIGQGKRVLVAMSGGVDSSVAAALLKADGYEVVGCFMRLGSDDSVEAADGYDNMHLRDCDADPTPQAPSLKPHHHGCCSLNDASDARMVAAMLDVPFYVLNFKKDFGRIINYFVDEYNAGRTPNPCIRCNDWLKFGKLADYARSIDAGYVATGHYARIDHTNGHARLLRGIDHHKDQSYVLFGTSRESLNHMLLPLGQMQKTQTRIIAEQMGLPVFDKPDSQEICFVPDNDYARLVTTRSPDMVRQGDIVTRDGEVVGRHQGQQHFTIGQRRGVGVSLGYPVYVVDKDPAANTVTIGAKDNLLSTCLTADQTNWLVDPPPPTDPIRCHIKIRYNSEPVPGTVTRGSDDTLAVAFDDPQPAVTPGQAVVCYDGDVVICGGWIERATPA